MSRKNQATPQKENNANKVRLYVSIELSLKKWKLGMSDGRVSRPRVVTIPGRDWGRFDGEIQKGKQRFGMDRHLSIKLCLRADS